MSDRSRAATTNGNGVSRTRNGTTSAASVRRNLFQSQLTRRPTGGGSSSTSAETLHLDVDVLSDTSEIVVRDKHGEIELGDPPTPMLEDEDDVPLDHRQETEKERQRLAEAVKHHQINRNTVPEQPEELLEAVKTSLRAKVAALAEDNWMFEPEEQPRG
ncbi:hypothetical protein BHE90_007108 [Fusarium euwallaceae]|uniref:Uncharacterized protein n=5 Tax=Fusarium solani species complex TaxID=232080 RepID=A0A3M2SFT0_9HYPO|nr:hypothetical protein CDV36_004346 [Fusarium kuroshium]RSL76712.1 hypothetical protein CEP51_009714 [Fusarium floridanum]RSL96680.1 hypothetical protein CEP52_011332 [Fusarium oligoseptatum]RSM05135.1 hypothetical protein CDV31_009695 [Fusarium ambrosium]RTE78426.1 hypothetical protein BHE90_007108 [Fusarium euwallaceae]